MDNYDEELVLDDSEYIQKLVNINEIQTESDIPCIAAVEQCRTKTAIPNSFLPSKLHNDSIRQKWYADYTAPEIGYSSFEQSAKPQ